MKPLLIALLLFVNTAMATEPNDGRVWATAISSHATSDRKIIFRYIKEFQAGFKQSTLPDRIIITWRYESTSGMPSVPERERMDRLEDLLHPVTEATGLAALVLVSTGENLREWTYYSRSEERFFEVLNKALGAEPRYPIDIHAARDAGWRTYDKFREGVRE